MKSFEDCINENLIIKVPLNPIRSKALLEEVTRKKKFYATVRNKLTLDEIYPNFILEMWYDIVLETIRAHMCLHGFQSKNSHEAEIAYVSQLHVAAKEMRLLDEVRFFRNGIKYYGRITQLDHVLATEKILISIHTKIQQFFA